MCTYYYCENPAQNLANMSRRMFLDDGYEESISFSFLDDKLADSIGFDKSDKDFWVRGDCAIKKMATRDFMCRHSVVI